MKIISAFYSALDIQIFSKIKLNIAQIGLYISGAGLSQYLDITTKVLVLCGVILTIIKQYKDLKKSEKQK